MGRIFARAMGHHHTHHHPGGQQPAYKKFGTAFAIGILLNVIFVGVEIFYGLLVNSTALLADASHNAGDVLSLIFAYGASWLADRQPTRRHTYGYRKATILVAILNAIFLLVAVAFIGWEAVERLLDPSPVAGPKVMLVAGIGTVINFVTAWLFFGGQGNDLNIRGAYLHMVADTAVSFGVVAGGGLIYWTGEYWIDPVMSFIIIGVILYTTLGLLRDSLNLAMDAVPKHIDLQDIEARLRAHSAIQDVHDLHVWAMSTTEVALTAHLVVPDAPQDEVLRQVNQLLAEEFDIHHTTLQIERSTHHPDEPEG